MHRSHTSAFDTSCDDDEDDDDDTIVESGVDGGCANLLWW